MWYMCYTATQIKLHFIFVWLSAYKFVLIQFTEWHYYSILTQGVMEISVLKALLKNISCFFRLSSSENVNFEPFQKYYEKIEEILKLIKPVLDAIVVSEIASDELLQKAFSGLSQSADELRELFENWHPLMSKVYFVCFIIYICIYIFFLFFVFTNLFESRFSW